MRCHEHFLPTFDGLNLHVRDYIPEHPEPRVPVVCIPGLTRNSADFEVVAPSIAALGRRVLAFDLRGRGRSECDREARSYRLDVYASDVLFVLDTLDVPSAVFLGTSLGGIVTMFAAISDPEFIAAAVLDDIAPIVDPTGLACIASYGGNIGPFESWSAVIDAIKRSQGAAYPNADEQFWKILAHRVAHQLSEGRVRFSYDPGIAQGQSQQETRRRPICFRCFTHLRQSRSFPCAEH